MWNGLLDRHRVFEVLEMVVFFRTGVRPRSWDEPDAAWMEDTTYEPEPKIVLLIFVSGKIVLTGAEITYGGRKYKLS
ncbi:hypothetical protein ABZP36_017958 [Zizania latifolia]